ncbi:MAG: hypothetical protein WA971_15405 [Microbacterium sp.]
MPSRHSAAVYRRRRLAVAGAGIVLVVAIAALVWLLIAQPWAGAAEGGAASQSPSPEAGTSATPVTSDTPTPAPEQSGSAEPVPSDSPTPAIVACTAADVQVEALSDADTYAAGVLPKLSIRLKNVGPSDCTINVGSTQQVFTVTSGNDVWWRSTDCQQNPSDMIVTLAKGQTVTSAQPVEWDRTRSAVDTCGETNRPRAPAGGSSYHVSVSIGGFPSRESQQFLLY